MPSSDTPEVSKPLKEEASVLNEVINRPEVVDSFAPAAAITDEPPAADSGSHIMLPSKRNLERLGQRVADESDPWVGSFDRHCVPIISRTSTQQNGLLSGAGDELLSGARGRKPTVAVLLSRRVRKVKFAKWLTKRLRRVRHRRQKPALMGQELTEANLKRIERADRIVNGKIRKKKYNSDMVKARQVDLLMMHTRMERMDGVGMGDEKNTAVGETEAVGIQAEDDKADVVLLPSGRVMAPSKGTPPAVVKHDTIGRRAAAWFKEQTGSVRDSVDLTRFLLREMKSEMKAAV
ncbi:hypothetical protein BR93DRAFT_65454 [Coniochaeta sp. PMI_546]|nr:hypothetical protein BR93DRAFT_65454 [Coniochaeta sp. PMI_546]